jgi:EmrB/QacA subfamily drug resistance transporter
MTTQTAATSPPAPAPGPAASRPVAPPAAPWPGPEPASTGGLSRLGLATVLLGTFLPMLDFFIVNVALPTVSADLHAPAAALELVVAGYGIAYAMLLVVGGRLGDALGRRRVFQAGLAGFTVTSLLCGLAPSITLLVAARAAQGGTAALMVPQVLATLQVTTQGERRSRALGLFAAVGGVAAVVGQLLGGVLVSADIAGSGWRSIFLVNVPVGLAGLALARRHVPDTRAPHAVTVDVRGTALFGATMLALLVPLMEGRSVGWPLWTWVSLAAFPLLAAAFVAVERRVERAGRVPLLMPSVLDHRGLRLGLLMALPFFAGFGGFMFVVALALQQGVHLGPMAAGAATAPMAVAFFAASLLSARLVARHGRRVLTTGALVQAAGLVVLAGTVARTWPHLDWLDLAPAMLVAGFGQGLTMSTLMRVVLADVPPERAGVGAGVLATTQQVALALGVATLGSLFLTLGSAGGTAMRTALVSVLAVQTVLALTVSGTSLRLRLRAGAPPAVRAG